MFEYSATIIRWVDGDTVHLNIDLGFHVHIQADCRLSHVNTPDVLQYKTTGIQDKARDFCMAVAPEGAQVTVQINRQEKYGRYLATMLIPGKPQSLNEMLIAQGLADPYEGGRKT